MKQQRNIVISVNVEFEDGMDETIVEEYLDIICEDLEINRTSYASRGTVNVKSSCAYVQD